MVNLIISFVVTIVAALAPWSAYSAQVDFPRADQLIKKYSNNYERPKSCPMESKKFSDLIAKTNEIKDVLKGNCLKKDSDKMTEVLDSIKGIQEELKNQTILNGTSGGAALTTLLGETATAASATTTTPATATTVNSINGLKYSALFSNITTMFKKNQCSMEDGRVLEMTADLIYDSTQIGVLAGNKLGLVVAGSGFLISSALRLIDLIIKQRFNFEKSTDRQTFVKLNCAFYEIRRELDAQGALDIENNTSREDFRDVKVINEILTLELKKLDEEKVNTAKSNVEIESETFKNNIGDVSELKKTFIKIQKYLQPGVNASSDLPSETQKLLMISQLAQDYDLVVAQVHLYKALHISSIPMLDDLFLNELNKFDPLNTSGFLESLNISAKDFNDSYRAKILFHIVRIQNDILKKEQTLADKSSKAKNEFATALDKKKESYTAKLIELKKIETRLGNLISPKEYSGLDDGSENMVTILDNHKKISAQLYGEWGDKFLKFSTYKSYEEVKEFNERVGLFETKYSEALRNNQAPMNYICQDAQKIRLLFKNADSLVQEGFDFVATNKDIIHSDVKNYYNGNINEETNRGSLGSVEKVQRHYKSAILALKAIKGETIPNEDIEKYLSKPWVGSYYIGKSMIEVFNAKTKAKNIQDIYEKLSCQKNLVSDLDN